MASQASVSTSESSSTIKSEMQSFLKSFIEQSSSPQQHGLKFVIREPMACNRFFTVTPTRTDSGAHTTESILQPDTTTWSQDYRFISTMFLGIEYQLFLHDILIFNVFDLFMIKSQFLSLTIAYLFHCIRTWIRHYFGLNNLSQKAMIDKCFILW